MTEIINPYESVTGEFGSKPQQTSGSVHIGTVLGS